jgi:hypothetical protein
MCFEMSSGSTDQMHASFRASEVSRETVSQVAKECLAAHRRTSFC